MPQTGNTEADDEALELLGEVRRHSFAANPATVGPFGSSRLSWSVTAPDGVKIRLDGLNVAASGERLLVPAASETHRLSAKAGHFSKSLGAVTVHVNLTQCTTRETALLPQYLIPEIQQQIDDDDSGIYFRRIPVLGPGGSITYVRSKPSVMISAGRLNVLLQLAQEVDNFPNPAIDLSVSFGLHVIPNSVTIAPRRIAATDETINVDISFPWYAWLVPGAMIALPIAIDNGKEKARVRAMKMTNEIVGWTGPGPVQSSNKSLNNFFLRPDGTEKHDVGLYVDSFGDGIFAVTYCPDTGPGAVAG